MIPKFIPRLALCVALSIPMGSALGSERAPPTSNLLTWPRTPADEFGCYLEKSFRNKDPRFNCALKGYKNQGDPCKNTDSYYEGPAFPDTLEQAAMVHPLAMGLKLSWEQGRLQQVTITLQGRLTDRQARQALNLPASDAQGLPENVMAIDIQYPTNLTTAVSLTGFDHMGAGDVECDAAK